jgi:surfactin synthase thioesterase subunit
MHPDEWLPLADPAGARLRLVCCAHAGGGVAPFMRWRGALPVGVALCPVRRPGREGREGPPLRDVAATVEGMSAALATRPELPTVVLGHSLGAAEAYELARSLQASGRPPRLLVVSGRQAPEHPLDLAISALPDAAFLDALASRYGGVPAVLRDEPELLARMLPALRADVAAAEAWRPRPGPTWSGPTWVVYGDRDPALDAAKVDRWRGSVAGAVEVDRMAGDHFYLYDARSGFVPALCARLAALLASLPVVH